MQVEGRGGLLDLFQKQSRWGSHKTRWGEGSGWEKQKTRGKPTQVFGMNRWKDSGTIWWGRGEK